MYELEGEIEGVRLARDSNCNTTKVTEAAGHPKPYPISLALSA